MFDSRMDQLVYDFNVAPLDYVDASWLAASSRARVSGLAQSSDAGARGSASAWLLETLGLATHNDFEFSDPYKRLLLLEPQVLRDVVLFIGLSALSPLLRHWIEAPAQRHLQSELGADAYRFFCRHVLALPAAAVLSLSREQQGRLRDASRLASVVSRHGVALLFACCGGLAEPAVRRARLKFHRAVAGMQSSPVMSAQDKQSIGELAIGCVIRQRHPSWHWLF
jgi:YOP proteins translocation protein K (YscK)/Bacterial type III secretion protein (HrpB4)